MGDFAGRLRELRKERGLRQKDLAEAFGIAQTTIANYEKKIRFPDEVMLGRIADFFSVSLDFLLGRSDARGDPGATPKPETPLPPSSTAARYLDLVRNGGFEAGRELVDSLSRGTMGLQRIYLEVLEPALKETGRLWARGDLMVGEEHMISTATQQIMGGMFPRDGVPRHNSRKPRCCVLAVLGEEHVIGPRMVSDFLRMDGWNVQFLGGNLGLRHLLEVLKARVPQVLAVSVTSAGGITEAADLIAAIRDKDFLRATRILVGGQAFRSRPTVWRETGADGTGDNAESAVTAANGLVGRASRA